MEVRNCPRCGKMFVFVGRKICPDCREKDERDFDRIREYLRSHPGANLEEIHEGTGVEKEKVLEFLREGRLEVRKNGITAVRKCEVCGRVISRGRICDDCVQQFKSPLKRGNSREVGKRSRMYITEIWEKKGRK